VRSADQVHHSDNSLVPAYKPDYNQAVAALFQSGESVAFDPESASETLRAVPAAPGVFALYGAREGDQPYLTRTADLRRRMTRLLAPPESQSKRLNLRDKVVRIEYCVTGSEFESTLVLYHAAAAQFGYAEARRGLKLHTPYFLRLTMDNRQPRVYSTNKLSKRGLAHMYGPFPSRSAAERYCDAVLDLFKLRRCYEDLQPYPEHPGCVYQEMKKCLAPCNESCTPEQYAEEAAAVKAFFDTGGESMLAAISAERSRASAEMEFEKAATLHTQWQKVKTAAALADALVRPVPALRAVMVQAAAHIDHADDGQSAAVFLLDGGYVTGPERLLTLGVRAVKEQTSVGSSLFAQPLMLQAVPLAEDGTKSAAALDPVAATLHGDNPEDRAARTLAALEAKMKIQIQNNRLQSGRLQSGRLQSGRLQSGRLQSGRLQSGRLQSGRLQSGRLQSGMDVAMLSDHLSLLRRWYYRPEKQRTGEIFFPNMDGSWPLRRILRGAARMVLGEPAVMTETQRELARGAKVRILHEGRPDVERTVPVVPQNARNTLPEAEAPESFTSRRALRDDEPATDR